MQCNRAITLLPAIPMITLGLLLVAGGARASGLIDLEPEGPITLRESELIATTVGLMLIVLIPVFAMTVWFSWCYRSDNTRTPYSPNWFSKRIEVMVWLMPTLIVAVLAGLTWVYTHRLNPYKPINSTIEPLKVQVVALDWKWLFIYPEQEIATINQLVIPAKRPISFDITSDTVMNSFFIPQLGGQVYAMAGMRTELHLLADRPGVFFGENTQYSGRGFPYQHFQVVAKSQGDFNAWVSKVKRQGAHLTWTKYRVLEKPSEREPFKYLTSVTDDLFERIISQYKPRRPVT